MGNKLSLVVIGVQDLLTEFENASGTANTKLIQKLQLKA